MGVGQEVPHSRVDIQGRGVGPRRLQVLHGVPLVDAALLRADAALVVGGPDEGHAPREVVVPSCQFTGLVKDLQGRPGVKRGESQAWEAEGVLGSSLDKGFLNDKGKGSS